MQNFFGVFLHFYFGIDMLSAKVRNSFSSIKFNDKSFLSIDFATDFSYFPILFIFICPLSKTKPQAKRKFRCACVLIISFFITFSNQYYSCPLTYGHCNELLRLRASQGFHLSDIRPSRILELNLDYTGVSLYAITILALQDATPALLLNGHTLVPYIRQSV